MGNIMDINKAGFLISLLLLTSLASAISIYTEDDDLNFEDLEWVGTSFNVITTLDEYVFLAGNGLPDGGIYFRITPVSGGTAQAGSTLAITCGEFSTTISLDSSSTWLSDEYAVRYPLPSYGSDTWTSLGDYCILDSSGQDLQVTLYHIPETQSAPVPSSSVENIVQSISNVIQAGFDILQLMIIITGMLLLFFLIVFTWKIFEFFIRRVRAR
jgi:hypothetical protein